MPDQHTSEGKSMPPPAGKIEPPGKLSDTQMQEWYFVFAHIHFVFVQS